MLASQVHNLNSFSRSYIKAPVTLCFRENARMFNQLVSVTWSFEEPEEEWFDWSVTSGKESKYE